MYKYIKHFRFIFAMLISLTLIHSAYAAELLTGFDKDKDIPVLNEQLRQLGSHEVMVDFSESSLPILNAELRSLAVSRSVGGIEPLSEFSESSIPVLNEDIRKLNKSAAAVVAPEPGIDSYVVLMLHADGTDASTTFTDSSLTPKTVTPSGDAQIDTAQSKFGGASGLFDGSGDYLTVADSDDLDFGTGDFTIDWWARLDVVESYEFFHRTLVTPGDKFRISITSGFFNFSVTNTKIFKTFSYSADTWYHFALVRSGTQLRIYINGTVLDTVSDSTDITLAEALTIGKASSHVSMWMDEIRWSKGIARWTENFTPPTSAYN